MPGPLQMCAMCRMCHRACDPDHLPNALRTGALMHGGGGGRSVERPTRVSLLIDQSRLLCPLPRRRERVVDAVGSSQRRRHGMLPVPHRLLQQRVRKRRPLRQACTPLGPPQQRRRVQRRTRRGIE